MPRNIAVDELFSLIEEGSSASAAANRVAPNYNVTPRTILRWAQHDPRHVATQDRAKKARQIAQERYQIRRAALRIRLLEVAEGLLQRIDEPCYDYVGAKAIKVHFDRAPATDVRSYVWSAAVLLDKIRLEEGKVQGRTEVVSVDAAAQVLRAFVEEAEDYANAGEG